MASIVQLVLQNVKQALQISALRCAGDRRNTVLHALRAVCGAERRARIPTLSVGTSVEPCAAAAGGCPLPIPNYMGYAALCYNPGQYPSTKLTRQATMAIILSITASNGQVWALGPEGLFTVQNTELKALPQPETAPACCLAIDSRLLVGGAPHGVAFSLDEGASWQAGWMDGVADRIVALAADPRVDTTGVLLAGSENSGILRSADRGHSWYVSNFGLQSFQMLSLAWAPVAPAGIWPRWEVVFAGTEEGLYRSPNGGLGWKRAGGLQGMVLAVAVAPDFHASGVVLAGAEDTGLWRSTDGGRTFAPVAEAPASVNALAATDSGWLLSDPMGVWHSVDGLQWTPVPDARPALALLAHNGMLLAGGPEGVEAISLN